MDFPELDDDDVLEGLIWARAAEMYPREPYLLEDLENKTPDEMRAFLSVIRRHALGRAAIEQYRIRQTARAL